LAETFGLVVELESPQVVTVHAVCDDVGEERLLDLPGSGCALFLGLGYPFFELVGQ
jgi:hypothetical protein